MRPPHWLWPTLIAAILLSSVAAGDGVLPGDATVTRAVQRAVPPSAAGLIAAVNELGQVVPGALTITLVVALLLLAVGRRSAALLVAATLPVRVVNPALKALMDSPRPSDAVVMVSERADGLGFPSGHATGAMLLYGAIIAAMPRIIAIPYLQAVIRTLAALAILLAGVSRVATGAHWPSDVVGGYLWGGVMLGGLLTIVHSPKRNVDGTARPVKNDRGLRERPNM